MKEFDAAQIESTQHHLEELGCPLVEASVGDLNFSYYVVPQELNPELPDFAMRLSNVDPATGNFAGIFGVSDSVPEELRDYWVAHEVVEFREIGVDTPGRCLEAEERVLAILPNELRQSYVERRTRFFVALAQYFREQIRAGTDDYTIQDVLEADATHHLLRRQ